MKFSKIRIRRIVRAVAQRTACRPSIGIICGSGLAPDPSLLKEPVVLPFSDIPFFPIPAVAGHKGRFIFGVWGKKQVVIQEGRLHYYEGLPFDKVLLPLYVMKQLGIGNVFITNAAGGINPSFSAGDIMLVKNHINLMGADPLIGQFSGDRAAHFVDMRRPYDGALIALAKSSARKLRLKLQEGIYLGDTGPQYETEAEVAAFRTLGADAVGMSLVPETIFARYLGINVLALSVITNIYKQRQLALSHADVVEQGSRSAVSVFKLLGEIIGRLS
jgi:purine-nucleoside phosphorylase